MSYYFGSWQQTVGIHVFMMIPLSKFCIISETEIWENAIVYGEFTFMLTDDSISIILFLLSLDCLT